MRSGAAVDVVVAISQRVFVGCGFRKNMAVASNTGATIAFTALAGVALVAFVFYTSRGRLKSPWSRGKRKYALSPQQWRSLFTPDGKLLDGGVELLNQVRSGGVDPSIRAEVWPFLLGVYDLSSSKRERDAIRTEKRKEYEKLRRLCHQLLKHDNELIKSNETGQISSGDCESHLEDIVSPDSEVASSRELPCSEERFSVNKEVDLSMGTVMDECADSRQVADPDVVSVSESSDSDSSEDPDVSQTLNFAESSEENGPGMPSKEDASPSKVEVQSKLRDAEDYITSGMTPKEDPSPLKVEVLSKFHKAEDFVTWQRIIRLDAVRANGEWTAYSPVQAAVSDTKARHSAEAVGLKDYDHLEPCRIFHAARLVAILEAYALYDPEIGYCQGMSDLLSPIISVMTEDHEAFWCFVGFMKKARHNFRLDEVGIRRQLNTVSKIIKYRDSHLYEHLQKLQAEDCFFVYRMVVVLFRRELTFEQTLCLWEVMWADQTAIRAGIGKRPWSRIRQRIPPTEDLLLYAIAASVLQRRKQIIEKYSSMDEILRECNSMAGHLDVWKLLDDAHNLVVSLHDKIETSL
ncbi:small G protein signaling modulator 2-like isoform X2 [Olea europaea var. sylvestris]|uniref:small G protein signaling modulator 2-like isoform X2 n=1 Tax=Olea europaea var. sylvestris TaxID=158386 RepID=UPI000C1D502C|nr:small G protein signaling modulator 2-like isoform X2 [Olea europaea var. sylvestris]